MSDHDPLCPLGLIAPLGLSKIAVCLCPEFSAVRVDEAKKAYERGAADERERIQGKRSHIWRTAPGRKECWCPHGRDHDESPIDLYRAHIVRNGGGGGA